MNVRRDQSIVWDVVAVADHYEVELLAPAGEPIVTREVPTNSITIEALLLGIPGSVFNVHIRAVDAFDNVGAWSVTDSLVIEVIPQVVNVHIE